MWNQIRNSPEGIVMRESKLGDFLCGLDGIPVKILRKTFSFYQSGKDVRWVRCEGVAAKSMPSNFKCRIVVL